VQDCEWWSLSAHPSFNLLPSLGSYQLAATLPPGGNPSRSGAPAFPLSQGRQQGERAPYLLVSQPFRLATIGSSPYPWMLAFRCDPLLVLLCSCGLHRSCWFVSSLSQERNRSVLPFFILCATSSPSSCKRNHGGWFLVWCLPFFERTISSLYASGFWILSRPVHSFLLSGRFYLWKVSVSLLQISIPFSLLAGSLI
jgi:hypothetical protein